MRTACLAIFSVLALGCGGSAPVEVVGGDLGGENLLKLNNLIIEAIAKNGGKPLKTERDFKSKVDAAKFDAIAKSPNDGQPYVIIWGVDPVAPVGRNGNASVVIAYEKKGKDGLRWVMTSTGVDKMTAEQFKAANFPSGHNPPG